MGARSRPLGIEPGEHYKLSGTGDKVTIQGSQLTGNGTLTLVDGDLALFSGNFSADGSASPPLLTPDADVSYKLNKIGGFAVKTGLTLSQVNLSSGQANSKATLRVNPPGLDKSVSVKFNITPGPTYAGTVSDFDFVIAGFSVSVAGATITDKGIAANPATVTGPAKFGAKTSQVSNFQITTNGLNVGGTGSSFPLPDIYVADNAQGASGTTGSVNVNVQNVAPTVSAGGPYEVPEGKTVILTGAATDPAGSHDTLTYVWDLDGDGVFGETGAGAARGDETGAYPTFQAPFVDVTTDVSVTLRVSDGDGGSTDSQANITIQCIELALATEDTPDPVRAGNELTYKLSVTNIGDAPADHVVLTDTLSPAWVTLASFTPPQGGKCEGTSTVVCKLPAIAVGATVVFTGVLNVHRDAPANQILPNEIEVSSSASYTAGSQRTTVYRTRATEPGDCNGDTAVDAADISSIVLRIFNDTFEQVTGCDANSDTRIDAGDITCAVLIIFNGPNACSIDALNSQTGQQAPSDPVAAAAGPVLRLPGTVTTEVDSSVSVPVRFEAHEHEINSLAFSVDYDETRLSFDPADGNGDGVPDAVHFDLPGQFNASVSFDEGDSDGELDVFIADISPPLTGLSDGEIALITLNHDRAAGGAVLPATFSHDPPASFGDTSGRSVPGTAARVRRHIIFVPLVAR